MRSKTLKACMVGLMVVASVGATRVAPVIGVAAVAELVSATSAEAAKKKNKAQRKHHNNRNHHNSKNVVVNRNVYVEDDDDGIGFVGGLLIGGATAAIISSATSE